MVRTLSVPRALDSRRKHIDSMGDTACSSSGHTAV